MEAIYFYLLTHVNWRGLKYRFQEVPVTGAWRVPDSLQEEGLDVFFLKMKRAPSECSLEILNIYSQKGIMTIMFPGSALPLRNAFLLFLQKQ